MENLNSRDHPVQKAWGDFRFCIELSRYLTMVKVGRFFSGAGDAVLS